MAIRTNDEAVRAVIDNDEDISLQQFILTANALTDQVSSKDSNSLLNAALLTQIETYLAAHFYALRDQQFHQERTADASATYQGQTGMGLDATLWGQQAQVLDVTGYLRSMGKGTIGVEWLGKAPSDQTDYVDRD